MELEGLFDPVPVFREQRARIGFDPWFWSQQVYTVHILIIISRQLFSNRYLINRYCFKSVSLVCCHVSSTSSSFSLFGILKFRAFAMEFTNVSFPHSSDHWRKNVPFLAKSHRVYSIDLIGYGYSDKPNPKEFGGEPFYTFETWAAQINDFCHQVVKDRAFFICNSIGGELVL